MSEQITSTLQASILDPADNADVTLVADAVTLGTTMRLATGQIVTWTEDAMRRFAPTFVGTPVNVLLGSDNAPTEHSTEVVGSIKKAVYDEVSKTIKVFASLWGHYYPETIQALKDINRDKKLQVSMEFLAAKLLENEDGSVTPDQGRFSGLGIIARGADLGNSVLLLASALEADRDTKEEPTKVTAPVAAPVGSYEWIALKAAEYFANKGSVDEPYKADVIATFNNTIVYSDGADTFRMDYTREGQALTFGEPVKVEGTFVPLEASRDDAPNSNSQSGVENMADEKELEALKASRDALETERDDLLKIKADYEALKAESAKAELDKAQELKASERISELEKIKPYDNEADKAEHKELLKTADDATFNTIKKLFASMAELKGGVANESTQPVIPEGTDPGEAEALANLPKWKEELLAQYKPAPSK